MNRNKEVRPHFRELALPQLNTVVAFGLGLALASGHPLAGNRGEGLVTPARPSLWTP